MDNIRPISHRDVIKSARQRWLEQYKDYPNHLPVAWGKRPTPETIKDALAKLDLEKCSETDVDKAVGFKNWAALRCQVCLKNVSNVVRLGADTDRPKDVCPDCLQKAVQVSGQTKGSKSPTTAAGQSVSRAAAQK